MNKKAQLFQRMAFDFRVLIAIFFVLIIIGVIAIGFVLFSAVFLKGFGDVTDTLVNIPSTSNGTNISDAARITFGNYNTSFQQLKWISFSILLAMFIGTLTVSLAVRVNEAWFPIYIVFVIIAVIFSIFISASYNTLLNSGTTLSTSLNTFATTNWMILNLPALVAGVGTLGVILIFIRGIGDKGL